jgi:hypothetical protein
VSWFVSTLAGASHGETVQCHDGELSPTCSFETRDQTRSPALTIEHWQEQRDRLVAAQPPCELVVRRHVPLSQWSWVEQETAEIAEIEKEEELAWRVSNMPQCGRILPQWRVD